MDPKKHRKNKTAHIKYVFLFCFRVLEVCIYCYPEAIRWKKKCLVSVWAGAFMNQAT